MGKTFVFIRHAESAKNLKDVTGGKGDVLTEAGARSAEALAKTLLARFPHGRKKVYASDTVQTVETAETLARAFGVPFTVESELRAAHFGAFTGLTTQEILERFPQEYVRLDLWRRREIDVTQLKIPDMEDPVSAWERVMAFLSAQEEDAVHFVVCTRSIMVLIINFVQGNRPIAGGNYKHVEVKNCETVAFRLDGAEVKRLDE